MNLRDDNHWVLLGITDPDVARPYAEGLEAAGHHVRIVAAASDARKALNADHFDVVVLETDMGERRSGLELGHEILREHARPEVIVMANLPSVANAVAVAKAGAFDYLSAPVSVSQLVHVVDDAGRLARTRQTARHDFGQSDRLSSEFLTSTAPAVQDLSAMVRMVASHAEACALVIGESGSGTDLVARIVHAHSANPAAPFVVENLLDADAAQLEVRLFGTAHEAVSGGDTSDSGVGAFAQARGGTLVLRGVGDMPFDLQPKLLSVLETRVFRPVGGRVDVPFRGRVIALTDREVGWLADGRSFSQPLFFRLASVTMRVPPLRERTQDLPRLAHAILAEIAADAGRPGLRLSAPAVDCLARHTWPGNLRELRNVLTRVALLCETSLVDEATLASIMENELSRPSDGPTRRHSGRRPKAMTMPSPRISDAIVAALDGESRAERERIEEALAAAEGHRERAAASLGMSRTTLWTRMRLLGLDVDRFHKRRAGNE